VVLDALSSIGLWGDGTLMALSSYENRVYQVQLETPVETEGSVAAHSQVVVKFYRPGRWSEAQILEEHAFAAELMAAEVPVVGPLLLNGSSLHHFAGFAFSVSPRRGGRMPELDDFEVLEWIGRFLGRLHQVGERRAFAVRPELNLATFGWAARDYLLQSNALPADVLGPWRAACHEALALIEPFFSQNGHFKAGAGESSPFNCLRLHGDCHPGNILWTPTDVPGGGPHFVDLDDARSGPAVQDLWMLLSGERAQRTHQLSALLDGYEQMRPFDRRELALIEPLRTLRMVHYSAWLTSRWSDPTFPQHFPWFGSSDYWSGQTHQLIEQIEAMQAPPLWV
jgi:Ser/Thr protein kinase RdoA (MazF antagonist)